MDKNEVSIAFEILLEELETVVDSLNEDGSKAFQERNYERAKQLIEDATRLTDFHHRVKGLQREWQTLFAAKAPARLRGTRRGVARLSRGLRTREETFVKPMLEAIVELGGSAPKNDVLDVVGRKMASTLNEYDRQRLPSAPKHEIRWRKTAEWCHRDLVSLGLIKGDSARGVWEISDEGKSALGAVKDNPSMVHRGKALRVGREA
ncbi:MAG: hypothetical protein FJ291_19820 [Planctomycetes bacterium]|nr:hypothetical protein [Planctomycetota bacterium]